MIRLHLFRNHYFDILRAYCYTCAYIDQARFKLCGTRTVADAHVTLRRHRAREAVTEAMDAKRQAEETTHGDINNVTLDGPLIRDSTMQDAQRDKSKDERSVDPKPERKKKYPPRSRKRGIQRKSKDSANAVSNEVYQTADTQGNEHEAPQGDLKADKADRNHLGNSANHQE